MLAYKTVTLGHFQNVHFLVVQLVAEMHTPVTVGRVEGLPVDHDRVRTDIRDSDRNPDVRTCKHGDANSGYDGAFEARRFGFGQYCQNLLFKFCSTGLVSGLAEGPTG